MRLTCSMNLNSEKQIKLMLMTGCVCRFMICCDHCGEWFHGSCVGISMRASKKTKEWICPRCIKGNSQRCIKGNSARCIKGNRHKQLFITNRHKTINTVLETRLPVLKDDVFKMLTILSIPCTNYQPY